MAGLNLTLQAGVAPAWSQLPGNAQALLVFIAQYMLIQGGQNFNGINFGASTPAPANRGIPWFKTDQFGNPLGLFSWNGMIWAPIPTVVASGTTATRPVNAGIGTEFYDTTISALLIYTPSGWSTATGNVGDVKECKAVDITTALVNNPGWSQDADSVGLVIGGAGAATSITAPHPYGQIVGEEMHTLALTEIPSHAHVIASSGGWAPYSGAFQNGAQPPGVFPIVTNIATANTATVGGGSAHNNIQPTIFYWRLVKVY